MSKRRLLVIVSVAALVASVLVLGIRRRTFGATVGSREATPAVAGAGRMAAVARGLRARAGSAIAPASSPMTSATMVVPSPSSEPPPMSQPERAEQQRIEAMFAERIKGAVAKCFAANVHARAGKITFRYDLAPVGAQWVLSDAAEALEIVDSTIPESEDDAALDCMRRAAKGAALPIAGSLFDGSGPYHIYWSWYLA
jgi:hypothetical protein